MHACAQAPGGNGIVLYATMYRGHEIITLLYKTATKDTHSDSTCEIWSRQSPRDREDKPPEAKDKIQGMFIFQRSRDSSGDYEKYRNG